MIHQHFTLVPSLTVTENVLLGLARAPVPAPPGAVRGPHPRAGASGPGCASTPAPRSGELSVGEQQRVEIVKMLYRGARVLIMDEPTAVLAPQEAEELFRTLRDMTARGESIVFISHKLDEVLAIADRITVLRRGKVTAAGIPAAGRTRPELARLMVGREVLESHRADAVAPGPGRAVGWSGVSAVDDRGLPALRDVSLEVRAGEIVGLAGVAGNGQSELAEVITGLRGCTGRVTVHGVDLASQPPLRAIDAGVAHVPEDRIGIGQRARPVARRQPDDEELPASTHRARLDGRTARPHATRPRSSRPSTRSSRPASTPRRGCCPAATSSGSSSPARSPRCPASSSPCSRRAASMSAPSRRSIGCCSSAARRAPRSCSSARTWTRSWRSPIASRSSTRGTSRASLDIADADIHTLGLLMTGGTTVDPRASAA